MSPAKQIAEKAAANGASAASDEAREEVRQFVEYLSVDQALENAPADCEECDVEAFGGKVRVRALTAAQSARVRQVSVNMRGQAPEIMWAAMEMEQFRLGVIVPKFNADQVRTLHLQSGRSFAAVIAKLDEISGLNKEELRKAQQEFQGAED